MKYLQPIGILLSLLVVLGGAALTFYSYLNGMDQRIVTLEKDISDSKGSTMSKFVQRNWCNATHARKIDGTYKNDTGLPIELAVSVAPAQGQNQCRLTIFINGAPVLHQEDINTNKSKYCAAAVTIPPNSQYRVDPRSHSKQWQSIHSWWELRPSCDLEFDSAQ